MTLSYFLKKSLARGFLVALPIGLIIWGWQWRTPMDWAYGSSSANLLGDWAHEQWHVWPLPHTTHVLGFVGEALLWLLALLAAAMALIAFVVVVFTAAFDLEHCPDCDKTYRFGCAEHQPQLRKANQRKALP